MNKIAFMVLTLLMMSCSNEEKKTNMKTIDNKNYDQDSLDKDTLEEIKKEAEKVMKAVEKSDKTKWPQGHEKSGEKLVSTEVDQSGTVKSKDRNSSIFLTK